VRLKRTLRDYFLSLTSITDVVSSRIYTALIPVCGNKNFTLLEKDYPSISIIDDTTIRHNSLCRTERGKVASVTIEIFGVIQSKLLFCDYESAQDGINAIDDFADVVFDSVQVIERGRKFGGIRILNIIFLDEDDLKRGSCWSPSDLCWSEHC